MNNLRIIAKKGSEHDIAASRSRTAVGKECRFRVFVTNSKRRYMIIRILCRGSFRCYRDSLRISYLSKKVSCISFSEETTLLIIEQSIILCQQSAEQNPVFSRIKLIKRLKKLLPGLF